MELYLFSEELAIRLQAGAFGSLVAALTYQDRRSSVMKRIFCGWIFAAFGSPVGAAVAFSFLGPFGVEERLSKRDFELVSAFLCGLIGWQLIGFFQMRARRLQRGKDERNNG